MVTSIRNSPSSFPSFRKIWILFLVVLSLMYVLQIQNYLSLKEKQEYHNVHTPKLANEQVKILSNEKIPNLNFHQIIETVKKGKEPLVQILQEAGVTLTQQLLDELPSWGDVIDLYGNGPILEPNFEEKCHQFRQSNPPSQAFVGIAGLFHTGTNALASIFRNNVCHFPNHEKRPQPMQWQVPWGKHVLASEREDNHEFVPLDQTLAVVMIRDPFFWKQSMCRYSYSIKWGNITRQQVEESCPNVSVPVDFIDGDTQLPIKHWDSIFHYWNDWNRQYFLLDGHRIIIRYEDMLFHSKKVAQLVCECAGGQSQWLETDSRFVYAEDNLKIAEGHGKNKDASMVKSMVKYGNRKNRLKGYSDSELEFAKTILDEELMTVFHYNMNVTARDRKWS